MWDSSSGEIIQIGKSFILLGLHSEYKTFQVTKKNDIFYRASIR